MGYIYVDDATQREMLQVYSQYRLNKSISNAKLLNKYYENSRENVNANTGWRCNATPPSMRRKSALEALLTFDFPAVKDSFSYQSTRGLTGFEKIMGDLHNAAVATYNPIATRDLLKDKYGFNFKNCIV